MGKKDDARTFLISVAAELAGMHAQTLRTYDRLGLVSPRRSSGGGRRYSQHDVELLREVQRLSQDEGVNLAGIKRIIELTNQVEALQSRLTGDGRRDRGTAGQPATRCRGGAQEHCSGGLATAPLTPLQPRGGSAATFSTDDIAWNSGSPTTRAFGRPWALRWSRKTSER